MHIAFIATCSLFPIWQIAIAIFLLQIQNEQCRRAKWMESKQITLNHQIIAIDFRCDCYYYFVVVTHKWSLSYSPNWLLYEVNDCFCCLSDLLSPTLSLFFCLLRYYLRTNCKYLSLYAYLNLRPMRFQCLKQQKFYVLILITLYVLKLSQMFPLVRFLLISFFLDSLYDCR